MSAAVTLKATDSIGRCREEMDRTSLRNVPVVDDDHRVIGYVSNRDLCRATRRGLGLVADILTAEVCTVRPWEPALRAVEHMITQKVGCLAVVGPDERLVGVITETAFLLVARHALTEDEPTAGAARSPGRQETTDPRPKAMDLILD